MHGHPAAAPRVAWMPWRAAVCAGVIIHHSEGTHTPPSTHTSLSSAFNAPRRVIWYVPFTSCSELSCSGCYDVLICSHCQYILITTSLHHICHDLWPLLMGNATTCANHFASLIYTASNPQRLVETLNTRLVSPKLGRWGLWVDFYANRDNDIKRVAPLAPSLTSSSSDVSSAGQDRVQDKLHMDWKCDSGRISGKSAKENDTKRGNKHTRWVKIKQTTGEGKQRLAKLELLLQVCVYLRSRTRISNDSRWSRMLQYYYWSAAAEIQSSRVRRAPTSPFLEEMICLLWWTACVNWCNICRNGFCLNVEAKVKRPDLTLSLNYF